MAYPPTAQASTAAHPADASGPAPVRGYDWRSTLAPSPPPGPATEAASYQPWAHASQPTADRQGAAAPPVASGPPGEDGTGSLTGQILGVGDDEDAGPPSGVARAVLTLLVIVTILALAGFATAFATGAFG